MSEPSAPTMQSFQPSQSSRSYQPNPSPQPQRQVGQTNRGMHADDIKRQVQQQAYTNSGLPYIPPTATKEQVQEIIRQHVEAQMNMNRPTADNGFRQMNPQQQLEKELIDLLNEAYRENQYIKKNNYKVSPNYYEDLPAYNRAKGEIKDQLAGKKPISFKDAYYYAEAAYGGLKLEYDEFNQLIENNKNYILNWLAQEGYDINNPEALHYGIQSFMSDTLYLLVKDPDQVFGGTHQVMHVPFSYDYIDYESVKDRRNYFVTKTLATGTGQCHTMPVSYLLLAEALGVEAHLSYNPLHSFVKFKNNEGMMLNYETTVGRFMPDQVYFDVLPTMSKAHQNKFYVNTISDKQLLATILVDLSVNFMFEHHFADETIVADCMNTAEQYFENSEFINTSSRWVKKKSLAERFNRIVEEKGIKDLSNLDQYPEAKAILKQLQNYLAQIQASGIEEFPEGEYMQMMAYHDKQGKLQRANNIDTKSKRDLFIKK